MTRTCKYEPCSKEFGPNDARQEFCEPTCRANQHYLEHPEKGRALQGDALRSVAGHPLAEARAEQEASDLKSKLSQIIYQGIIDRLKFGSVHADDLEPLFPEEVRDTCRRLVGAQFGSLASRHYIQEVDRRKSTVPSRKGAKSGVFEFTRTGREKLVGVGGRGIEGPQSPHSGESPTSDTDNPEGTSAICTSSQDGGTLDRPGGPWSVHSANGAGQQVVGVDSGDELPGGPAAPPPGAPPEPLSLLPEVPSMFDPDQRAA